MFQKTVPLLRNAKNQFSPRLEIIAEVIPV